MNQLDDSLAGHSIHCPKCNAHLTSLLLCPECGDRYVLVLSMEVGNLLARCCPTCGEVHGEGLDCGGIEVTPVLLVPGQIVVLAAAKPSAPKRKRRRYIRPCLDCDPEVRIGQLRRLLEQAESEVEA